MGGLQRSLNERACAPPNRAGLVLDEVEDPLGATPQRMSVWGQGSPRGGATRLRKRTPWAERLVASTPCYYGWVVAALVAVSALIVSPAQVYCVGVVLDIMIAQLQLTRLQISSVYATAALLSPASLFLARRCSVAHAAHSVAHRRLTDR